MTGPANLAAWRTVLTHGGWLPRLHRLGPDGYTLCSIQVDLAGEPGLVGLFCGMCRRKAGAAPLTAPKARPWDDLDDAPRSHRYAPREDADGWTLDGVVELQRARAERTAQLETLRALLSDSSNVG